MYLFSTLRAPMSHRRTFSDTAFTKLFHQKELKQGPSSSGNSPSNTPSLFSPSLSPPPSLTPPAPSSPTIGVAGIVSPPHHQTTTQDVCKLNKHHHCIIISIIFVDLPLYIHYPPLSFHYPSIVPSSFIVTHCVP